MIEARIDQATLVVDPEFEELFHLIEKEDFFSDDFRF